MKKLITGALMSSIYYMVMASMIFGTYTGHSQFIGIAAAAFWNLICWGYLLAVLSVSPPVCWNRWWVSP